MSANVAELPFDRPRRKVAKPVETKKPRSRSKQVITKRQAMTIGTWCAAIAASFLPVAAYVIAHVEAVERPWMWVLVAAALAYSAPTVAKWATKWAGHPVKAWGFVVLLEGVMVFSQIKWLSIIAVGILVAVNAYVARVNARNA